MTASKMLALFCAALLLPLPAAAKPIFQSYEGNNATQRGEGGAKSNKSGMDFWTYGSPSRDFEIIGVITNDTKANADVVSKEVAKAAKENGADALIVIDSSERSRGGVLIPNAYGGGIVANIARKTTRYFAVRYLTQ